ncbi:hypothetical protein [Vibrio sp. Hal054]|uniref:hypothetical protein n=1 Tax=Vibrio sp. Hal054 TaxID=3035158 RepID=UPI00301D2872
MVAFKKITKGALVAMMATGSLLTSFASLAEDGRGAKELLKDGNDIALLAGVTGYNIALAAGIFLFIVGAFIFAASSRNNGQDNGKTKKAAIVMWLIATALCSPSAFLNLMGNTVTGENVEYNEMLNSANN